MRKEITTGTVITDGNKEYVVKEYIGKGGFAVVYRAESNGQSYAVKVLQDDDYITSIKNEFDIARKVSSDHAIRYYYMNEDGVNDFPCFIIMEYAEGGTLDDEYKDRQSCGNLYTTEELYSIYAQLIDGMIDIGAIAVHRDIKLQNILISDGVYKISDYGLAKYLGEATRSPSKTMKGARSFLYYAPELWANPEAHGLNDRQVDIYAMGIVFYQLANLDYPYELQSDFREMHMTSRVKDFNKSVDIVFKSMIEKMMKRPRAERYKSWIEIKEFLNNSDVGKGRTREAFVDNLLADTAAKRKMQDDQAAKKNKEKYHKEEAFKRLVMQIRSEIYDPLKEITDEYNRNSPDRKIQLYELDMNLEDETYSFMYQQEPLTEYGDMREISFSFQAKHTENREAPRTISVLNSAGEYGFSNNMFGYQGSTSLEYKYFDKTILLWGIIEADCGAGINIAVLENKEDLLYGELKTFIRTPNDGSNKWLPIDENKLRKLCGNRFNDDPYHSIESRDYSFDDVKALIKMNNVFGIGTIRDNPTTYRFR